MSSQIKFYAEINNQIRTIEATLQLGPELASCFEAEFNEMIIEFYGSPAKAESLSEVESEALIHFKNEGLTRIKIGRLKLNEIDSDRLREFRRALKNQERWTIFSLFRRYRYIYQKWLTYEEQMEVDHLVDMARESL
jgi:hypothetical protein